MDTHTNQSLTPTGTATWYYGGNGTFEFYIASGQTMNFNFSGTSATCGTVTATRSFLQSSFGNLVVTASPVQTSSAVTVALIQVPDTTITIVKAQSLATVTSKSETKISLYDINFGNLMKTWDYPENQSANYSIHLSGVPVGIYLLKVERNNRTATTKIKIQ